MELKIIEPVNKYVKEFESPEEFNVFYAKNKDEIDSQTTHILNKKYHIKGLVITKIKGELCLKKPWIKKNKEESTNLEDRVQRLEETVNKIIDLIQPN